ncbi:MAG TPA: ABC transporter substrate-binding protein [Pseudomonadales bacterium]|nr:ABC transporter substrate-binding protein [Pseudomonadales bacterium]
MLGVALLLQATLTIGVTGPVTSAEYLPVRLAESAGHFASEKVAARLRTFRSPAEAAEALAAGRVDLAAITLDAALRLGHVHGVPPRLVFGLTTTPPVALLVPAARRGEIVGITALAGKTVGIPAPGTPEAEALTGMLAAAELSPARVTTVSLGERPLARALSAGEVDAAVLADPWASRLVQEGRAAVLADLRQPGGAERWIKASGVHAAVFVAGNSRLGERELVPVARALLRAMQQVRTASPGELAAGLGPAAAGEEGDFALRVEGVRGVLVPDGLVTEAALEAGIELARARAKLPVVVKLPWDLERLLFLEPLRQAIAGRPR